MLDSKERLIAQIEKMKSAFKYGSTYYWETVLANMIEAFELN